MMNELLQQADFLSTSPVQLDRSKLFVVSFYFQVYQSRQKHLYLHVNLILCMLHLYASSIFFIRGPLCLVIVTI